MQILSLAPCSLKNLVNDTQSQVCEYVDLFWRLDGERSSFAWPFRSHSEERLFD